MSDYKRGILLVRLLLGKGYRSLLLVEVFLWIERNGQGHGAQNTSTGGAQKIRCMCSRDLS